MSVAFYNRLLDQLRTTGIAKSTADNYVSKIKRLIGTPRRLKDLSQLKDTETILESISHLSLGTRGNYLSAILAVLRLSSEGYQEAIKTYEKAMEDLKTERSGIDTSDMTPTQEKNWVEWSEVLEKHKALEEDYQAIKSKKAKRLSPSDFRKVQDYVVLSLYTKIPPRRNRDYLDVMFVADKDSRPKTGTGDANYYFQKEGIFQFNVYKTAKHYGSQEIKVPDDLKEILDYYSSVIPSKVKWLICSADGQPQRSSTAMTRILNRIMGKNVGSSMLRHIYLTNKYDISEMTKDSQMMGHSLTEQREYLKKRPDAEVSEAKTETETKSGGSRLDNLRIFTDERLVLPSV